MRLSFTIKPWRRPLPIYLLHRYRVTHRICICGRSISASMSIADPARFTAHGASESDAGFRRAVTNVRRISLVIHACTLRSLWD